MILVIATQNKTSVYSDGYVWKMTELTQVEGTPTSDKPHSLAYMQRMYVVWRVVGVWCGTSSCKGPIHFFIDLVMPRHIGWRTYYKFRQNEDDIMYLISTPRTSYEEKCCWAFKQNGVKVKTIPAKLVLVFHKQRSCKMRLYNKHVRYTQKSVTTTTYPSWTRFVRYNASWIASVTENTAGHCKVG